MLFNKQNNVDTCDGGVPNGNRLFFNCHTFESFNNNNNNKQLLERSLIK